MNISLNELRYTKLEENQEINYLGDIVVFDNGDLLSQSVRFQNKTFICEKLIFENFKKENFNFYFYDCIFDCEVEFINCNLDEISFTNTKSIKSLSVRGKDETNKSSLKAFKFHYDNAYSPTEPKPKLSADFYICNLIISDNLLIQNIDHIEGQFQFIGNELGGKGIDALTFNNSNFCNARFFGNNFKDKTTFKNSSFKTTSEYLRPPSAAYEFPGFYKNTFTKVSFSKSNFKCAFQFESCDFYGTTLFDEIINIKNSNLHFKSCKFTGFTHFGLCEIDRITFEYILFERNVSFKKSNFNFMKFEEMRFEKGAYFDDLNKNNPEAISNWNRTTLHEIKRELANSHNQIDYLRFKAYELNAYKKEVDKSKLSWKDSLILYFNEESNSFGLDWTKGIVFIFQWSFLFYILYIISYSYYVDDINCIPKIDDFLINYLKFTNPFSFLKSPIEDAERYFLPFLFFMLGKILVSYGIYQTVQAFRKFGVNGG